MTCGQINHSNRGDRHVNELSPYLLVIPSLNIKLFKSLSLNEHQTLVSHIVQIVWLVPKQLLVLLVLH